MSHTCKIDDMDKDKNTVLHYACTRDQLDSNLILTLCEFIRPEVSFIEKENINGYTPVHYICENGAVQVLQCLLEHFSHEEVNKALFYPNNADKNTPLHLAFKKGRIEIISYLLKCTELAIGVKNAMAMQNDVGKNIFHLLIDDYGTQKLMPQLVSIIEIVLQSTLQDNDIASCLSQRNSEGFTPIHYLINKTSEYNQTLLILSCLLNCNRSDTFKEEVFSLTSSSGDTLVHSAVARGRGLYEIVKFLVIQKLCFWKPTASNHKGETPLHVACDRNYDKISLFLCEHGCDPHQLDMSGCSPLYRAFESGYVYIKETLSMLISSGCWKPEQTVIRLNSNHKQYGYYYKQIMIHSESADTLTTFSLPLFHCAVFMNTNPAVLKQMADIVVKHKLPNVCDSLGNTVLHVYSTLMFQENYDFLKGVLALENCDANKVNNDGNTPLHIASSKNNKSMVKLLIESDKCKSLDVRNNENNTPLYYTTNREIINDLVMNGADPKDVADSARVKHLTDMFKAVKDKHPLNLTVTALVLGNSLAGKTTLLKSLTNACNSDELNQPSVGQLDEKCERTAGIEMSEYVVNIKERFQRVLFYDFAGHPEFQSTHSILLQNRLSSLESLQDSPLLFVIVIDITASDKLKQLVYWVKFIQNCQLSCNTGRKPEILIIGSHVDKYSGSDDMLKKLKHSLCQTIEKMSESIDLVENPIFLNCCKPEDNELKKVEKLLIMSTEKLEKLADLDNRWHLIFSYLYDHFSDKPVKFSELQGNLQKLKQDGEIEFQFTKSTLQDLLTRLHQMQHILLIGPTSESCDFWILTAKAQNLMFHKVQGLLFSGEDFDMHPSIESNVGVISSTEIKAMFPDSHFEYDMLQQFLVYSEFCKKIDDEEVLQLIQRGASNSVDSKVEQNIPDEVSVATETCDSIDYFFFPGLVKETREKRNLNWKVDDKYSFCSGWSLECTQDEFFNALFLQVLLLRLIFQFAATSMPESILHKKCIIWKNGVFWSGPGVEMLVEVTNQNQTVIVLVRCFKDTELEAIKLRSAVLKEVHKVKAKHSPATNVIEFVICNPSLDENGSLTKPVKKVAVNEIAASISKDEKYVQDNSFQLHLINKDLLCFEPYTVIDNETLTLFDPDEAGKNVPVNILSSLFNEPEPDAQARKLNNSKV